MAKHSAQTVSTADAAREDREYDARMEAAFDRDARWEREDREWARGH